MIFMNSNSAIADVPLVSYYIYSLDCCFFVLSSLVVDCGTLGIQ